MSLLSSPRARWRHDPVGITREYYISNVVMLLDGVASDTSRSDVLDDRDRLELAR
jgi:hypothetical protein